MHTIKAKLYSQWFIFGTQFKMYVVQVGQIPMGYIGLPVEFDSKYNIFLFIRLLYSHFHAQLFYSLFLKY